MEQRRNRERVRKYFNQPSRTKQHFKKECDINEIMRRFKKNTNIDFLNRFQGYLDGRFGDFSEVVDYQTALNQLRQAEDVFMALPALVRKQFDNDPARFLDFVHDPANEAELVRMGLAKQRVQEEPVKTEAKSPVPTTG